MMLTHCFRQQAHSHSMRVVSRYSARRGSCRSRPRLRGQRMRWVGHHRRCIPTAFASKPACMVRISTIWGDADGVVCPNVRTVPPSAGYLKRPQVTKGLAPGLALLRRVPALRRRSVGPRRTDIHVLTALSRHPCRSAHCASSAFGLHPSRALWCLACCGMKIKSHSALCAV